MRSTPVARVVTNILRLRPEERKETNTMKWLKKHISKRMRQPKSYHYYGTSIDNPDGELIYQDNGGSILLVGHLDTVMYANSPRLDDTGCYDCPQLDDRLGVAIIMERIGGIVSEPYDVLLCDCEEVGNSTAQHFVAHKQYRWACEFDRAGSDTVLYQYEGGELESSLTRCGIEVGQGSYSDISVLDIGCEAMNFGCGYHDQHTRGCYCYASEVENQLAKFANWYRWYGGDSHPYVPRPKKRIVYNWRPMKSADYWRDLPLRSSHVTCADCNCSDNYLDDDFCINCGASLLLSLED